LGFLPAGLFLLERVPSLEQPGLVLGIEFRPRQLGLPVSLHPVLRPGALKLILDERLILLTKKLSKDPLSLQVFLLPEVLLIPGQLLLGVDLQGLLLPGRLLGSLEHGHLVLVAELLRKLILLHQERVQVHHPLGITSKGAKARD
jgi:hypothetical protein